MKSIVLTDQQKKFSIGEINLVLSFHTESSVSFDIIGLFSPGWIDVHFPCNDHIKVQIRGALAEKFLEPSCVHKLVPALLEKLGIPHDETYEALFFKPTKGISMGQPVDREGMTDRIQTTRKYKTPGT